MAGRGGKRPGAGKPKGVRWPSVINREEGKKALQELVFAELRPMVRAVLKKAVGVDHMMLRGDDGQWIRLTEQEQIEAALNHPEAEQGKTYWIHTKDPDVAAAKDLFDRVLGKPIEEVKVDGNVKTVIEWGVKPD